MKVRLIAGVLTVLCCTALWMMFRHQDRQLPADWQITLGGKGTEELHIIRGTADGGYVLGGWSVQDHMPERKLDFFVVKLTSSGEVEWQQWYGGMQDDRLSALEPLPDGGFAAGGFSPSGAEGNKTTPCAGSNDFWLLNLDEHGNVRWQKTYGGTGSDEMKTLLVLPDGGLIAAGHSDSQQEGFARFGSFDNVVMRLDADGNVLWQKSYGGDGLENISCLVQNSSGILLGGFSTSGISGTKTEACRGQWDFWIVQLDMNGKELWQKTLGGSGEDGIQAILVLPGEEYLLGGWSTSPVSGEKSEPCFGGDDYWIVKTDNRGNTIWDETIGGSRLDVLYDMQVLPSGDFLLGGVSESDSSCDKLLQSAGQVDYWLVQTGPDGKKKCEVVRGGSDRDFFHCVFPVDSTGFLLGGHSFSGISGDKRDSCRGESDVWVIRVDGSSRGICRE